MQACLRTAKVDLRSSSGWLPYWECIKGLGLWRLNSTWEEFEAPLHREKASNKTKDSNISKQKEKTAIEGIILDKCKAIFMYNNKKTGGAIAQA